MNIALNKFVYKWLIILFGILAYWYIYNKLACFSEWEQVGLFIKKNTLQFIFWIFIQLLLMILNIGIESKKWHLLVSNTIKQSFKTSVKQVLVGYSIGSLTPARLGEPVGRLIQIPRSKRLEAMSLSYAGSFIQTVLIIIIGLLPLFLNNNIGFKSTLEQLIGIKANILLISICSLILATLFAAKYLIPIQIHKWSNKIRSYIISISNIKWAQFCSLTVLRYLVFSSQLMLWIHFFNPTILIKDYILLMPIYYLFVTVAPSFILSEIGIRGSIGIFIFGAAINNNASIMSAIMLTWIINISIPTLLGASDNIKKRGVKSLDKHSI